MKSVKLTKNFNNVSYAEDSQSCSVRFSVAKKISKDCFTLEYKPFRCKDFLNEMVISRHFGYVLGNVYGFRIKEPWVDKELYLTWTAGTSPERLNFENNIKYLDEVEEWLKVPISKRTKVFKTDYPDTYLIKMPVVWAKTIPLISLYTLILRAFSYKTTADSAEQFFSEMRDKHGTDGSLWTRILTSKLEVKKFLTNYKKVFKVNPVTGYNDLFIKEKLLTNSTISVPKRDSTDFVNWTLGTGHHGCGIVSLAQLVTNDFFGINIGAIDWAIAYKKLA